MNDLISWLRQQLDTDEQLASARLNDHTQFGPSELDPDHALRQVQAHRAILDAHHPDGPPENWYWSERRCAECGKRWHKWLPDRLPTEIGPEVGCSTLRALVSIYSDRDGYAEAAQPAP